MKNKQTIVAEDILDIFYLIYLSTCALSYESCAGQTNDFSSLNCVFLQSHQVCKQVLLFLFLFFELAIFNLQEKTESCKQQRPQQQLSSLSSVKYPALHKGLYLTLVLRG